MRYVMIIFVIFLGVGSCHKNDNGNNNLYDPRNISRTPGKSSGSSLTVDTQGNIHNVWQDSTSGQWNIYYREIYADGNWGEVEEVSHSSIRMSWISDVAVDRKGNVYVVWDEEYPDSQPVIYYAEKKVGGWNTPQCISGPSTSTTSNTFADVSVDNTGRVHVVWMGIVSSLSYRRKDGDNWGPIVPLSTNGVVNPIIYADKRGGVHIVGDGPGRAEDIFYLYSPDGGDTWEESKNLSGDDPDYDWGANVCGDENGNIYVVWTKSQYGEGPVGIYWMKKDTSGNWSGPYKIPEGKGIPAIMRVDANGMYVVYDAGDVYFVERDSTGEWKSPVNVSQSPYPWKLYSLWKGFDISRDGRLYVSWTEWLSDDNWEIYFTEITH